MPRLSVSPAGVITAIYSDELVELNKLGEVAIERASNVEPDGEGFWIVLSPKGWPMLPGRWRRREDALAAEVAYLERKLFNS